jgi:uncharacterized protein (TIGR02058 family)
MPKRILLEVGTGNDWHGGNYTKAAVRAVEDALHHSSLTLLGTLEIDPKEMLVEVTIGVRRPKEVNVEAVRATIPHGRVTVDVVDGGLDIANRDANDISVIANAAIVVHLCLRRETAMN